jgi:hypothetical protein
MRTTLTLDKDVAEQAKRLVSQSGKTFKQVVNEAMRLGLQQLRQRPKPKPYRYKPHDMGVPLMNIDNIQEVLDAVEGPDAR